MDIRNVNFSHGAKQALRDTNLKLYRREVTAFIGRSGCGKTTLLRCLNRKQRDHSGARMEGTILLDGEDIYLPEIDPPIIRGRFGWIAQKLNPFPSSIRSNVAYGAKLHSLVSGRSDTDALVERCLKMAGLWDEVKDRLGDGTTGLSGAALRGAGCRNGARNPADGRAGFGARSARDGGPRSAHRPLRKDFTIVIITHNMQQAAHVAQRVAFFHLSQLVEQGDTDKVFVAPRERLTHDYVTGRFG